MNIDWLAVLYELLPGNMSEVLAKLNAAVAKAIEEHPEAADQLIALQSWLNSQGLDQYVTSTGVLAMAGEVLNVLKGNFGPPNPGANALG